MRIIGFNFKKLSAERKKDIKGKLEVKTHMDITKIEKETLDIAGEILRFSFVYTIDYNPEFATIKFEGTVLLKPEKKDVVKKIIKDWKSKKLPDELKFMIFNFIMTKCNLKALQLEEEFSLPLHISMPKLSKTSGEKATYTG